MVLRNVVWHKKHGAKMFPDNLAEESIAKKLLVLITGYKMSINQLQAKWHLFPMEDIAAEDAKRRLVVIPRDEGRDQIVGRLSDAAANQKIERYVWATPGLPMLIFVTLGLLVAVFFGDLVWLIVRVILG
jgi:hypothetical protein